MQEWVRCELVDVVRAFERVMTPMLTVLATANLVVQSADHLNPKRSGGIFNLSIMACAPIPGIMPLIVLATRDSLWTLLRFLHQF